MNPAVTMLLTSRLFLAFARYSESLHNVSINLLSCSWDSDVSEEHYSVGGQDKRRGAYGVVFTG